MRLKPHGPTSVRSRPGASAAYVRSTRITYVEILEKRDAGEEIPHHTAAHTHKPSAKVAM